MAYGVFEKGKHSEEVLLRLYFVSAKAGCENQASVEVSVNKLKQKNVNSQSNPVLGGKQLQLNG